MRPAAATVVVVLTVILSTSFSTLAQTSAVQPRITQPVRDGQLTTLKGNTHPLARPQFDRGAAPDSLAMNRMLLVLRRSPEQEAALQKLLDDQQDKSSPSYHKWLVPEEFGRQFGPTDDDIQQVTNWLASHGFQVAKVSRGKTVVEFSGTAGQVQEAFHAPIHKFVVGGEEHWANATDPQIPSALAPVVAGVHSLHDFRKKPAIHLSQEKIEARFVPGQKPQLTSGSTHALAPADYYTIYNFNPLGVSGASIAIVGRSNINGQDPLYFHYFTYDQAESPQVVLNGPDPGDLGGGEEAEADLDTTWAGAVAPGSAVTLVVSASTNATDGVDLSEVYIIDNNLADVMSESFGGCEAAITSTEAADISSLAEQAAAEGITYIVATGDSGSAGCDDPHLQAVATHGPSVNPLAATPYTVAVGGTMFNENGKTSTYWKSASDPTTLESAISYIPEDVWNESCATTQQCGTAKPNIWAGGGGASTFYAKPPWQAGVTGIPTDNARDVPDVSLTAAGHDPYLLCLAGSCVPDVQGRYYFVGISGTSAATPAFAGIMSLIGQRTGSRLGQPNYVLYRLAANENLTDCNGSTGASLGSATCIFNDITVGTNSVPGEAGYAGGTAPYKSAAGYDLATGLGSVNVTNLMNAWNTVTFNPTTTTATVSPLSAVHGSPISVNVNVVSNSGTGTPAGYVWLVGGSAHGNLIGDNTTGTYALDVSGSVSTTTHILPGGVYQVNAHYAGDGTYAPSDSAPPVMVNIQAEPSITTPSVLTTDSNGNLIPFTAGPYGSPVYLKAHVAGQSGYGVPTSYVLFYDNGGSAIATPYVNQNSDAISPRLSQLNVGPHEIQTIYYGDISFNSSTAAAMTFTITQATTGVTLVSSPGGQPPSIMATISTGGYGNPPSGTVTFYSGNTALGTGSVQGATTQTGAAYGTASLDVSQLAGGQYTLTAAYNGDANYTASTSAALSVNLQPSFSLSAAPPQIAVSNPGSTGIATLTVTAYNGFNGTVSFTPSSCSGLPTESTCSFGPNSTTGNGSTKLTITTQGPHSTVSRYVPLGRELRALCTALALAIPCVFWISDGKKKWRWLPGSVLALTILMTAGCGGGGGSGGNGHENTSDPGTPTGTYNLTVTGTSGSVSQSATIQLIVQ